MKEEVSEVNVIDSVILDSDTINDKVKHLDEEKSKIVSDLIKKNDCLFAKDSFDVGNVTKYECSINLSSDNYVSKRPYRCTYSDQQEIESQVSKLLERGMITESSSPNASPVTMPFKKDGRSSIKKRLVCVLITGS